jgi:hypothetical protein
MAHPVVENLAARAKLQASQARRRNRRPPRALRAYSRTNYRPCDRVVDRRGRQSEVVF